MNYKVVNKGTQNYVQCIPDEVCLKNERDAVDLVGVCGENGTQSLLVFGENLSPDFYHLSSGVAGAILLKFAVYRIQVAAVINPDFVNQGKFHEMVLETNRGNQFRVFSDVSEAEKWLIGG